jgi:hypothetical protein
MRLLMLMLLAVGLARCSGGNNRTQTLAGDTSMRSIDSSKLINNTSRLPQDSTTTTVTQ